MPATNAKDAEQPRNEEPLEPEKEKLKTGKRKHDTGTIDAKQAEDAEDLKPEKDKKKPKRDKKKPKRD